MSAATPGGSATDPRPEEPYVWGDAPRSPTEFRSPTTLVVWGVVCIVGGALLAVAGIAVAPKPAPAVAIAIPLVLGVVVALLGVWSIVVGRARARWRRELAAWQARHPGE